MHCLVLFSRFQSRNRINSLRSKNTAFFCRDLEFQGQQTGFFNSISASLQMLLIIITFHMNHVVAIQYSIHNPRDNLHSAGGYLCSFRSSHTNFSKKMIYSLERGITLSAPQT